MQCGCTIDLPRCSQGRELFVTYMHIRQVLNASSHEQKAEVQRTYLAAVQAYHDHVTDRREGDLRVKTENGSWSIEMRWRGQWIFQFAIPEETFLRAWLKTQGFWRYAQIDNDQPRDRITGYYHQRIQSYEPPQSSPAFVELLDSDASFEMTWNAKIDLKTQTAIFVTLQVARFVRPLTLVDRLYVQKRALDHLTSYLLQPTKTHDIKIVDALINEAISLRGTLESQGVTRPLEGEKEIEE